MNAAGLLEREAELAAINELVAAVAEGRGGAVAVEGPPGIGKTRLLQAARETARDSGLRVLAARGSELEQDFPWGVVRQLFEPAVAALAPSERTAIFKGAAARAATLFSEEPEPAGRVHADEMLPAWLHSLYWLTANLAGGRPMLLLLDDLHWADGPSLRFAAYLIGRLEGLRVGAVAATRAHEPGSDRALLEQIVSEDGGRILNLAPLSAEAAATLVEASLGERADAGVCRRCHEASGGNPFFLRELIEALVRGESDPSRIDELGPEPVARQVLRRLERLPEGAVSLARAVSVLGDGAELAQAAGLAGLSESGAADLADQLARAGILQSGRRLAFVHPVVRSAIETELPAPVRADLHGRAAALLGASGSDPDQVALHLLATRPVGDADRVELLRAAAQRALRRGAAAAAVGYLERALAEPPAPAALGEVLIDLGKAEAEIGAADAIDHLSQALELIEGPRPRAVAARELGRALYMSGRLSEAVEVLDRAVTELNGSAEELALELEAEVIDAARMDVSLQPLLTERLERFQARARSGRRIERKLLAAVAYEAAKGRTTAAEATHIAEEALAGDELLVLEGPSSSVFYAAVYALIVAERYEAARGHLDAALAEARATGSVLGFAIASCFRASLAFRRGDVADAEAEARAGLDAAVAHGWGLVQPALLGFLLRSLVERGELEAAEEALEQSGVREIPNNVFYDPLLFGRACLRVAQGRTRDGLEDLLLIQRRAAAWGERNPAGWDWRSQAALALAALGEIEEAHRLAAEELALAQAWGTPRAIAVALRCAALLESGEDRLELLREAAAVGERSGGRLEHARTLADLGTALRTAGRSEDARPPLREAVDGARRCGATALAERALQELVIAGARPRRMMVSGVESLTASERRTAWMAAEGVTNREIAQALFVTEKTVEGHLSGAYRKLGIGSRTELSGALSEVRR